MSKVRIEKIECSHCHAKGEFKVWSSVNVDVDPELKEKIFNEDLFKFTCPNCGKVTGIPMGFVYHDMSNKFILFFEFFKPENYDYSPMELPQSLNGYTTRVVYGMNQLKEKIKILENGLNDIAIERLKFTIANIKHPEFTEKGQELFFFDKEDPSKEFDGGSIVFVYNNEGKFQGFSMSMLNYHNNVLACEIDHRLTDKGCMCIDQEWISKIMKEE